MLKQRRSCNCRFWSRYVAILIWHPRYFSGEIWLYWPSKNIWPFFKTQPQRAEDRRRRRKVRKEVGHHETPDWPAAAHTQPTVSRLLWFRDFDILIMRAVMSATGGGGGGCLCVHVCLTSKHWPTWHSSRPVASSLFVPLGLNSPVAVFSPLTTGVHQNSSVTGWPSGVLSGPGLRGHPHRWGANVFFYCFGVLSTWMWCGALKLCFLEMHPRVGESQNAFPASLCRQRKHITWDLSHFKTTDYCWSPRYYA